MSPSAYIRTRTTATGEKRYIVRYRRGGRAFKVEHAGSFKTQREARIRRDFVAGELAAGRDPRESLNALAEQKAPERLSAIYETWKASRVDVDERTLANYGFHWKRISPAFGDRDPITISHLEAQEWINAIAGELTPAVVRDYAGTLRQLLDFAGVEPNPLRHHAIRYPAAERKTPVPPTDKHVLAMLAHMPWERRLLFAFLEQDGGRIGEHVAFTWGDVDLDASKILARPETVKGRRGRRRARWVQVPGWLMELLLERTPADDRAAEAPLFPWMHTMEFPVQAANKTMRNACRAAGIPHFHPHDLRHRRISLWHGQGIPAREIGDRVGQRQVAVTLDIYTHVMPLDEVPQEAYERVLVRHG